MQVNTSTFNEKEIMEDILLSQKSITSGYNTFSNECATPAVKDEFMSILNEEHQIQNEVFTEMQKRGWYQTQPAEQQKIMQAKQKFPQQI